MPKIEQAIKIVPHGRQAGLKPINLRGLIRVDPNNDDFFKRIIEQRKANESDTGLKHALKIIANSGAYGLFVQLDEHSLRKRVKLNVHSGEHHHRQPTHEIEAPGPWYFPPLASLITSGGRLLLAMAERCVSDASGTWLFCDTDSIAVVASKRAGQLSLPEPSIAQPLMVAVAASPLSEVAVIVVVPV